MTWILFYSRMSTESFIHLRPNDVFFRQTGLKSSCLRESSHIYVLSLIWGHSTFISKFILRRETKPFQRMEGVGITPPQKEQEESDSELSLSWNETEGKQNYQKEVNHLMSEFTLSLRRYIQPSHFHWFILSCSSTVEGTPTPERGNLRKLVTKNHLRISWVVWQDLGENRGSVLRPTILIGGRPNIAVERCPFVPLTTQHKVFVWLEPGLVRTTLLIVPRNGLFQRSRHTLDLRRSPTPCPHPTRMFPNDVKPSSTVPPFSYPTPQSFWTRTLGPSRWGIDMLDFVESQRHKSRYFTSLVLERTRPESFLVYFVDRRTGLSFNWPGHVEGREAGVDPGIPHRRHETDTEPLDNNFDKVRLRWVDRSKSRVFPGEWRDKDRVLKR